jgi:hypothetical protein
VRLRREAKSPLDDLIAAPTPVERHRQERANAKYTLRLNQQANVYSYMKDRYQAKTVGDVEEKLH